MVSIQVGGAETIDGEVARLFHGCNPGEIQKILNGEGLLPSKGKEEKVGVWLSAFMLSLIHI